MPLHGLNSIETRKMFCISSLVDQVMTFKLRGVENLRFDDNNTIKFSSFPVIFPGLFSKRNRKYFLRVSVEL